jgi:hypothetical protein
MAAQLVASRVVLSSKELVRHFKALNDDDDDDGDDDDSDDCPTSVLNGQ